MGRRVLRGILEPPRVSSVDFSAAVRAGRTDLGCHAGLREGIRAWGAAEDH